MFKYLLLMRHGESYGNRLKIIQGKLDKYGLTELGKEQVRKSVFTIKPYNPSIIISSPLKRAYETASYVKISMKKDIPLFTDILLEEIFFGKLQGISKEERNKSFANELNDLKKLDYDYSIFGGESKKDSEKRAKVIIEKLINLENESVLVVTHGGIMRILLDNFIENISNKYTFENGCVFLVIKKENNFIVKKINDNKNTGGNYYKIR